MDITGAAAIVTGGASGLGAATVRRLHRAGAYVVVVDIQDSLGKEVAAEVSGVYVRADITDPFEVTQSIVVAREMGPLRVLVNCAGILRMGRTLGDEGEPLELDDFANTISVNVIGTFNCIRLAAAEMARTDPIGPDGNRGVIISASSVAARNGRRGQVAYASSKAAIASITLPVARELAPLGIRVNCISPGFMDTPMLTERGRRKLGNRVLAPRRLGRPEEFADLVHSVIANDYINASDIGIDGGGARVTGSTRWGKLRLRLGRSKASLLRKMGL